MDEVDSQQHVVNKGEQMNGHGPQVNGHSIVNGLGMTELHDEDLTPPSVNGHASPELKRPAPPMKSEPDNNTPAIVEPEITVAPPTPKTSGSRSPSPAPALSKIDIYFNGPDQVIPSENVFTCDPDGCVRLKLGEKGLAAEPPISVPTMMTRTAERFPNRTALAVKRDGNWVKMSFKEYEQNIRVVSKAFIKLGLERFHAVCILGFNSPEWFISDLAAIYAGGFAAGIYTTNTPEACQFCAENSRANIIVVEDKKQLDKILKVRSQLPHLRAIVQYSGKPEVEGVLSWDDLLKLGREQPEDLLLDRLKRISTNQGCTLVYTSGTTGNPKGVMLSHDNLTWDAKAIGSYLQVNLGQEELVSYLPLSHVAAQVVDLYITITYGGTVYFADPDALKGSLLKTLLEVRPTKFLGVPRVWEKMYEKMQDIGRQTTGVKKMLSTWAKRHGYQHNVNKMNGNSVPGWGFTFANFLVLKRVKKALGLDRCNVFVSSAAPIALEVVKYFMSLDIPIMEAYGMSEAAGAHTLNINSAFRLESVGRTLPGMYTKLFEQDKDMQGEICMGGRQVFMGYLNAEEKTRESLDSEGWLHSGDIGKEDKDGFLFITGRIKELLITAGGENVPPVPIEDTIKAELSCVSNAMLIGDRRKFLAVLLTLKTETNLETGEPLDELSAGAKAWCRDIGSKANTVSEIINGPDEKVIKALNAGVEKANKLAVSNAQRVQKLKLLPKDFSIPGGELGPTMKVKRAVVSDMYQSEIENFYQ